MHRCLLVEELLLMVFKYRPNNDVKSHRATLAAVARTAKVFFGPAVGILWEQQDGLDNLLRCLPGVVSIRPRVGRGWSKRARVVLDNMPLPCDWKRFDFYARLVKSISLAGPDVPPTQSKETFIRTLSFLTCRPVPTAIFPNLASLSCQNIPDDALHYIPILAGPSLHRLEVSLHGFSAALEAFICHVAMFSPFVHILQIELESYRGLLPASRLSLALSQLDKLRTFAMRARGSPVSYEELAAISGLPFLNHLEIDLRQTPSMHWQCPSSPAIDQRCFTHLTCLEITDVFKSPRSLAYHSDLLRTFPPKWLRRLRIIEGCLPHPDVLKDFFVMLSSIISHQTLELLKFEEGPSVLYGISVDIIKPLTSFSNFLRLELQLNCGGCMNLTDSAFDLFARSWPKLQCLIISTASFRDDEDEDDQWPTLGALAILFRHCPDLIEVSFTLEACLPGYEPEDRPEPAVLKRILDEIPSNSVIKEIDLIAASITTVPPSEVATILLALMPNLERVHWENAAYEDEWDEVEEYLAGLRAVRSAS